MSNKAIHQPGHELKVQAINEVNIFQDGGRLASRNEAGVMKAVDKRKEIEPMMKMKGSTADREKR